MINLNPVNNLNLSQLSINNNNNNNTSNIKFDLSKFKIGGENNLNRNSSTSVNSNSNMSNYPNPAYQNMTDLGDESTNSVLIPDSKNLSKIIQNYIINLQINRISQILE